MTESDSGSADLVESCSGRQLTPPSVVNANPDGPPIAKHCSMPGQEIAPRLPGGAFGPAVQLSPPSEVLMRKRRFGFLRASALA
jgi:hypothetical protein